MCSMILEDLVDWYGGQISDWEIISNKKKGCYDVIVFENKTLGLTKEIVSEGGDYIKPEYFPTGEFWIYILQKNIDISTIDESKSYFDENLNYGEEDEENPTVILKATDGDYWYDQHSAQLIEDYFGVKDFCNNFQEPMENMNILYKDIPLKDVRESLEKTGMKFLGYRNDMDESDY